MPSNKRRKVHVNDKDSNCNDDYNSSSSSSKKKKKAVTVGTMVQKEVINGVEMICINNRYNCKCGKCDPIIFPGEYNSKTGKDILVPLSLSSNKNDNNCTGGNGGNVACGNAGDGKKSCNGSDNVTEGNAGDGNNSSNGDRDGNGGNGHGNGDIICPYCNDRPCHTNQFRLVLWSYYLTLCYGYAPETKRKKVYGFYNTLQGDIPNTVVVPNCIHRMVKGWSSSTHLSIIDNLRNFTWEEIYDYCNNIILD